MLDTAVHLLQTIFRSFLDLTAANWTVLLTALTLLVVIFQLLVMRRQTTIMKKQDEILGRRSNLSVVIEHNTQKNWLEFFAKNHGNKTARDFYWQFYVPHQFPLGQRQLHPMGLSPDHIELNDTPYQAYKGNTKDPAYPSRQTRIGYLVLKSPPTPGNYTIRWKTTTEDGINPPGDEELATFDCPASAGNGEISVPPLS